MTKIKFSRTVSQLVDPIAATKLDLELTLKLDEVKLLDIYLFLSDENLELNSSMITYSLRHQLLLRKASSDKSLSGEMFSMFLQKTKLLIEFLNKNK
jgi:hypothetical protein